MHSLGGVFTEHLCRLEIESMFSGSCRFDITRVYPVGTEFFESRNCKGTPLETNGILKRHDRGRPIASRGSFSRIHAYVWYNQLRNSRAIAPENRRGIGRETSWTKRMEGAWCLEVAEKVPPNGRKEGKQQNRWARRWENLLRRENPVPPTGTWDK